MFEQRSIDDDLEAVRDEHAPEALVLNAESDFETLSPSVTESLLLLVDDVEPLSYPAEWLPDDAPEMLSSVVSSDFTVGVPGDGGVAWTRQTDPPIVFYKPRLAGSPTGFVDFLLAEAFVEIGVGVPETFIGFFESDYRELSSVVPLDSADTYQLAAALFDAYVGLQTRPIFSEWEATYPRLYEEYEDAGRRLEPRIEGLPGEVARGETDFAAATELACSGLKHGLELPTPFAALDTTAYSRHGAEYAVQWAKKTLEALESSE
ncbi:MAG: hypothetical protein PPP58_10795 [Natronomonas sp.]